MTRIMNKSIWPYQYTMPPCDIETYKERKKWMMENLYHGGYYEPKWYINGDTYCFQDEKEMLHFMLRWS